MESRVELALISTATTSTNGFLDLFGNEPINIKMSIANIKDISIRSAPYTQTFTLPGTKHNNELLNQIFNIGSDSLFDARKKTKSYLSVDSIPVMESGIFQLNGITVDDNKKIDYQATIFSDSHDLYDVIGDQYLTDLDFSDLNHTFSYNAITASWTGTNNSYYYPLIDYGYDFNITDMNVGDGVAIGQLFPATQVKTIVDKIFSAAGFTYSSTFFSGTHFSNLYIPYNGDTGTTISSTGLNTLTFPLTSGQEVIGNIPETPCPFSNSSSQNFTVSLDYLADLQNNLGFAAFGFVITIHFYRSSTGEFYSYFSDITNGFSIQNVLLTGTLTVSTPLLGGPALPGETFWATYDVGFDVINGDVSTQQFTLTISNTQTVQYNTYIPKKIKQKDFLNSLVSMYCLYLEPDKLNSKQILVEPRTTYYSNNIKTKDWTKKLDLKVPINEALISEQQNKRTIFTYKSDKDYYNDKYETSTNRIFGDEYFTIDNDFIEGDKKIEVIFSPTPSIAIHESSLSSSTSANEFVIPMIGKIESNKNFGATDFNIRILQRNPSKLLPVNPLDYWKLDGVVQTKYPYLGMLNHPSLSTSDLGFGTVEYEFYALSGITNNNLVNVYWSEYLQQISDKDSRLITCNIYLTPQDINDFKFSDSIFLDGLTDDGGHFFIVNSIDYSPTTNASSKVELIKVKSKSANVSVVHPYINWSNTGEPVQVVAVGGARMLSTGGIGSGPNVFVDRSSPTSFAMGRDLFISSGSPRSMIIGSGSTIASGTAGAIVFGNNITATTANTVFVPNLKISPGGLLNGVVIETITGSSIWKNSTGPNSIISNNNSGNTAAGDSSFVIGYGNSASGDYSSIIGGYFNSATTIDSAVIGGQNNLAAAANTVVIGGNNITGTTSNSVYVPSLNVTTRLFVSSGTSNPSIGVTTLVAGNAIVLTNKVTAGSIIMLTPQEAGITFGDVGVDSRTGTTGFHIVSSSSADNRKIAWWIVEPF